MKAQSLLYAAVAAIVCLSCTREAEGTTTLAEGIELEFTAAWADEKSTADAETDSRTVLQEDGTSIWWTANEEINAFFGSRFAGRFTSTNTSTVATAAFQGTLNVLIGTIEEEGDLSKYWAVYPYNANNTCDGHSVTLTVASEQTASAGTFADKFFPAVANSKTLELAFYNVCGGARFSVTQEGVTKVIFKSNDGSPMAGKIKVGFGGDNKPQILEITNPVDSVVVDAPEGGFVPGTNYFAAMLPQIHAEGITIILRTQDKKATRVLENAITVNRSSFGVLDDVDSGLEYIDDEVQPGTNPDDFIQFEDPIAKYACVEKFDTNGDGEVSYAEAAAATSLSGLFTDWNTVTSFDEIRYFTGITSTANVFTGLPQLKRITIPNNITTLGTFKNCTALTSVVLPATLKTIPNSCFEGCTALKSVTLPTNITAISDSAFSNCSSLETLAIPSMITSIGKHAFRNCTVLSAIDLPSGLKTIGNSAFYYCQAITSLDFPASLTLVGPYAYCGCTALSAVTIGRNVILENNAFSGCSSLRSVIVGENCSIGQYAYSKCSALETVTIGGRSSIGAYALNNCSVLKSVTIGSGSSLGVYTFSCCPELEHVILPEDLITIPEGCFQECTNLKLISWPIELETVGDLAFYGCCISEDSIMSVMELPTSVKSIGSKSFWGVRHLIMPSNSITSIASNAFVPRYTRLYVPAGMVAMYKLRTNWSNYAEQIFPIGDYPITDPTLSVPEAVDLGLSVKWASFNLGAIKPEEYGSYYAWGETKPNWTYRWYTYKWCMNGSSSQLTKYCYQSYHGYNGFTDNKTVLDPEDDAATINLGDGWRMPTKAERDELTNTKNCAWEFTTLNGVNGYKITSKKTGYTDRWIFLPFAGMYEGDNLSGVGDHGCYWVSSTKEEIYGGYLMCFSGFLSSSGFGAYRCYGFSVRPVFSE